MALLRVASGVTRLMAVLLIVAGAGSGAGCGVEALPLNEQNRALSELGRHLFYERRLSLYDDRACGICHEQAKGFTDGFVRAVGTTGEVHPRNTLTLLNVSSRDTLSWLVPTPTDLAEHVLIPLLGTQPVEMGMAEVIDARLDELREDATYQDLLRALNLPQPAFDLDLVADALAAFLEGLSDYDAPYDRYLAGATDALTEQEKRGEALFFSEDVGCSACHGGADFDQGGDARHGWYNTGLYDLGDGAYPTGRQGLFEVTGLADDVGRYRVPTLRHLRFTGPYYHDGTGATLADVIENYNRGGRLVSSGPYVGDGRESPHKDPRVQPLGLSVEEMLALEAFLLSLSNEAVVTRASWSDPWPRE
ncbi:MAG: cytochrome-c peroxidase [Myxococcota bacterium]